jgi:uncharacterized protein YndB with AHSA1/START domain
MSTGEIATFRTERSFPASPEEVFDAWTNPEVLRRWWMRDSSWSSPGCEVDLRVGGRYVLRMRDADGELHVVGGEYREVDRPRRLVYTWRWEGDGGPNPGTSASSPSSFTQPAMRRPSCSSTPGCPRRSRARGTAKAGDPCCSDSPRRSSTNGDVA